jgi:uncharacterized membrane protein
MKSNDIKVSPAKKIWAVLLIIMGVLLFFAVPYKVQQMQEVRNYSTGMLMFIYFCFYLISIILVGGGVKKMINISRNNKTE